MKWLQIHFHLLIPELQSSACNGAQIQNDNRESSKHHQFFLFTLLALRILFTLRFLLNEQRKISFLSTKNPPLIADLCRVFVFVMFVCFFRLAELQGGRRKMAHCLDQHCLPSTPCCLADFLFFLSSLLSLWPDSRASVFFSGA